jgi:hypothetical protein
MGVPFSLVTHIRHFSNARVTMKATAKLSMLQIEQYMHTIGESGHNEDSMTRREAPTHGMERGSPL